MPCNPSRKPGRKSLAETSGEETYKITVLVTRSQYDFLMSQTESASSFIRFAISGIMRSRELQAEGMPRSALVSDDLVEQAREIQERLDKLLADADSELVDRARKAQELWDEMQDELENSE